MVLDICEHNGFGYSFCIFWDIYVCVLVGSIFLVVVYENPLPKIIAEGAELVSSFFSTLECY